MTVINFNDSLRARINQMADEHMQMQEAIMHLPAERVRAALDELDRHSAELSRLAARLYITGEVVALRGFQIAQAVSEEL